MKLDFIRKSIPQTSVIHGVEIKKLPVGKYLDAIESIKELPEILMKNNFPGLNSDEILKRFKKIDEELFMQLIGSLIKEVPETALRFISKLIDVPFEKLRNELTPKELKDVLKEFWKVNEMTDFFQDVLAALLKSNLVTKVMGNNSMTKAGSTGSRT